MENLWQDLMFSLRNLRKAPGFALVAILSLAIGIGANTAIFSVTNALLLRPLPFRDAERLVILWNRSPGLNIEQDWFSLGQYLDIKYENKVFEELAVALGDSFNLTGQGTPEHVEGARVSASLFSLLGAQPMLGSLFTPQDETKEAGQTVILSHALWQRRFNSDNNVIGQTIRLNDQTMTVLGVLPAGFALSKEILPTVNGIQRADLFLPLKFSDADRTKRGGEDFNIFARLKPGVSISQAQADMHLIAEQMKRQYPEAYPANGGLTLSVVSLLEQVVGDVRKVLYVLLGAVAFVLLIACANVANLLLARATVRQRELAIRAAVGASRWRLVQQLLTESVILALAGGVLGLGGAFVAVRSLRLFSAANLPRLHEVALDGRVLLFTFLVSLLTGVLFGLVPAWRASQVDLNDVLKESGRNNTGGHQRLRNLFVVAEIALSLMLLIGAGLLIRSYQRIVESNPGFDARGVLSWRLTLPSARYNTPESVINFYKQLNERLKQLPGVTAVGTNLVLPLSNYTAAWGPITIEGYVPKAATELIISNERFVSQEYFAAMRMPMMQGRSFDTRDYGRPPDTVVINEALAQRFWPNESPIGKRLLRGDKGAWRTVIGVVRDKKEFSLEPEPPIAIFHPVEQMQIRSRYVVLRSTTDPAMLLPTVTRVIRELDAELPLYDVATMEQRLFDSLARRRFAMVLLGGFAAIALLLASLGIYGVMAYWVNQRRHEIGIRMALGAEPRVILLHVIKQASVLVAGGLALGLLGAFLLSHLMTSLLFGVSATDWRTFMLLPLVLGCAAFVASYWPARRAAQLDPLHALRHE